MDAQPPYPPYPLPPSHPVQPFLPSQPGQPPHPGHPVYLAAPNLVQPPGVDGRAKASLALGVLGFGGVTAVAGVALGIRGLGRVRRTRQQGRGHAIAGLSLSTAWLVLFGVVGAYAVASDPAAARDAAGRITTAGTVNLLDLRAGDCFREPGTGRTTVHGVTATPCRTAHDAEAFARPTVSPAVLAAVSPAGRPAVFADPLTGRRIDTTPYPGFDTLQNDAKAACATALDGYVYDRLSLPEGVQTVSFVPEPGSWAGGVRSYVCVLQSPHGISRPLREDDTVLTADQSRYLKAVGDFDRQVMKIRNADASADLDTWQGMASDLAAIARREDAALAGPWPGPAQRAITALVAVQKRAIPLFDLAARATDPRDVRDILIEALGYTDGADAYAARKALGLSTSQGQAPNTEPEIA